METYKTAPALVPSVQQQSHKEFLTVAQVDEAKKMGIQNMSVKNTQYELLKAVKFQKDRPRVTTKYIAHMAKSRGRKKTRMILKQRSLLY